MRVGVIYCAYQAEDYLRMSLDPWVVARQASLAGHTFLIAAVSVPFEGFPQEDYADLTRSMLGDAVHHGRIDHVIVRDRPTKETDARGQALQWLVANHVDTLIQWDSDEVASLEDIQRILAFVEGQPYVPTFRVSYRNLVFTPNQWLAEPFTPMRIHRVDTPGGYVAAGFWDDNNVYYRRPWEGETGYLVRDADMACITIPTTVAHPAHYTWLNDERSRRKVEYQLSRGWTPSFRWDYTANRLEWNPEYYARHGLPLPEIVTGPLTPSP